jgi:replicative DNA helicase
MDNNKQKLLIEYLASSTDTFGVCQAIVDPEYFDPEYKNAVRFMKDYFEEYSTTPDRTQIEAETGVHLEEREVRKDQLDYTTNEIESFCRRRAIEKAVLASPKMIEEGNYGKMESMIRDAVLISLNRNLGLRYFENPEERLERMMNESPVLSTGWKDVDEALFGGISRKELLLMSATSGGGKSITLSNLAFNMIHLGYNVLYISLELAEDVVAQRFDTMFTGVSRKVWKQHVSEITTRLDAVNVEGMGVLDIKLLPSGTKANEIRAYLKEYNLHYGIMPDVLIIDYIDKMTPNQTIDMSDVWTKDKLVSEQARDLGIEYNMAIATASQLNRDAHKATRVGHEHIAGGVSKINESDVYWSIQLTEPMKASGQCAFTFQKTRNSDGVGQTVYLKWDGAHLRILDEDDRGGPDRLEFKKKDTKSDFVDTSSTSEGNSLLDLMSSV